MRLQRREAAPPWRRVQPGGLVVATPAPSFRVERSLCWGSHAHGCETGDQRGERYTQDVGWAAPLRRSTGWTLSDKHRHVIRAAGGGAAARRANTAQQSSPAPPKLVRVSNTTP